MKCGTEVAPVQILSSTWMSTNYILVPSGPVTKSASVRLKPIIELDSDLMLWRRVINKVTECAFDDYQTASQRIVYFLMREIGVYYCTIKVESPEERVTLFTIGIQRVQSSDMVAHTYEVRSTAC